MAAVKAKKEFRTATTVFSCLPGAKRRERRFSPSPETRRTVVRNLPDHCGNLPDQLAISRRLRHR